MITRIVCTTKETRAVVVLCVFAVATNVGDRLAEIRFSTSRRKGPGTCPNRQSSRRASHQCVSLIATCLQSRRNLV
jgi:hypothetical protein